MVQTRLAPLARRPAFGFLVAEVHLEANDLCVLLRRRYVKIFNQFAH